MTTQPFHPRLLTPGPIEVADDVLLSMSHNGESHLGKDFSRVFGETLKLLRAIVQTNDPYSQPFIISGSGSLGFDQVATNILEPEDSALVLNVGYWGDAFAQCLKIYGVDVDELRAPLGGQVELSRVEEAFRKKQYKAIAVTHVDTVSGVLSDVQAISRIVRNVSPDTLIVVDGVCSLGCEDLRFDDWGLDIVLSASQKALGAPAGLSILVASQRALRVFERRKTRPQAYFCSWKNWLPVMHSYELESIGSPGYFATPPCQLIRALHASLTSILSRPMDERLDLHRQASDSVKKAVAELGLKQVASKAEDQAHGMTAFYVPDGIDTVHILRSLMLKGVNLARGPQKEIAGRYIRFAHMGVSVTDPCRGDIEKGIRALETTLAELQP